MYIYMNNTEFEHDVSMLIMAFFPGEAIKVIADENLYKDFRISSLLQNEGITVSFFVGETISFEIFNNSVSIIYRKEEMKLTDRKLRKDKIKRLVYRCLSDYLQKKLPWGTLTGIRPVKMVRCALEQGISEENLRKELADDYYMSQDKIDLSINVARTELDALKTVPYKNGYSLYVGIPFCPSRCAYCSFTSYPLSVWKEKVDLYLDKLVEEIEFTVNLFGRNRINTIYVGGGTPTTLEPKQLEMLLATLRKAGEHSNILEFTVEAGRPDSITLEKLQVLKNFGVDRISINPQTMNDDTLVRIGRKHTVSQTISAYEMARRCGFDNINMDIIVGLVGEDIKDIENTLSEIKKLQPDSLTVHSLAIKRAARLNTQKEIYKKYNSINNTEIMQLTADYANTMGLNPYYLYRQKNMTGNFENVGYAAKGKISLYNILIMEEIQTIAAVGAGASSKIFIPNENRIERVENVKDVGVYIDRFEEMKKRKTAAVEKEEGRLFDAAIGGVIF